MVASFHSTSLPFIQILPVPGNPMKSPGSNFTLLARDGLRTSLLRLSAEWATVGTGVQRLAAVPAETRLRRLARFEADLNVLRAVVRLQRRARRARRTDGPRREHVVEQLARALV